MFYNIDFRTHLIGQRMERPITGIEDIDFWNDEIILMGEIKVILRGVIKS